MTMNKLLISSLFTLVAASVSACDFGVPDLNNPGIDELQGNPTRASVSAAATGLILGHRVTMGAANGYVVQLGILGREAYNFDGADPRFIGELLAGTLQKGSPFGGAFWAPPYSNIRLANIIIAAVDKVDDPSYTEAERAGIKGYAHTMIALDLLRVIITHEKTGAPIDTDKPFDPEVVLAPWASEAEVYARIIQLLDTAKTELAAAGTSFPFPLPAGFSNEVAPALGFNRPANFLKFNRAMRARVALYLEDWAGVLTALSESFINVTATTQAELDFGPTFVFTQATGDTPNLMVNPNIYAHPKLATDAERNMTIIDARFTRKVRVSTNPRSNLGLSSMHQFTLYPTRSSPVPVIRNEELILMRAEALFRQGMKAEAITDLNTIRTISGGLAPLLGTISDAEVTAQILYNRRYSLMFEGGHRWIDIRRFNIPAAQILDLPEHKLNLRYPIPQGECDARPGEPACMVTSDEASN
jgi:starch-binding outer membrane protein, SusD/RagB family